MTRRGNWYVDLVLTGAATAGCGAAVLAGVGGLPRIVLAAPLVLLLPGYALVSALFPRRASSGRALLPFDEDRSSSLGRSPSLREGIGLRAEGRLALSVLGSIAVVPLVALVADLVGAGVRLVPVLAGVLGTTALGLAVAAVARYRTDPGDRFAVGFGLPTVWFSADRNRVGEAAVPNVLLVVGLVLVATSAGYAAVAPPKDEQFSEFYVETTDVTINSQGIYPDTFPRREASTLDVYVGNREGSYTDYTVVAQLQRIDRGPDGNGTARVEKRQRLATRDVSLPAGRTKRTTLTFTPRLSGDDLRIVLYLYRGRVAERPSRSSAYRTLRLAVTVS